MVTILLAGKNCSNTIGPCLNSILNQSFHHWRLLYIDNGSIDDSIERVKTFKDDRISIITCHDPGLASALNLGLEYVHTKYVARMDADDVMKQNRLEVQFNFLEENPRVDLIGSSYDVIDDQGQGIGQKSAPFAGREIGLDLILFGSPLAHPTWFGRTEVFLETCYNPKFAVSQDYDFLHRAIRKGFAITNISDVLLEYRRTVSSLNSATSKIKHSNFIFLDILRQNGYITDRIYEMFSNVVKKDSVIISFRNMVLISQFPGRKLIAFLLGFISLNLFLFNTRYLIRNLLNISHVRKMKC